MRRIAVAGLLVFIEASSLAAQGLGPFELEGERGTLGIGFGTQFRGTVQHDGATTGVAELRRARLFLRGRFTNDAVRFKLQLDVAPRALELIDLYVEWAQSIVLRAGIAKIPFTRHWDQSFLRIPFVDWPLTERYFGGGRQLGLTLQNEPAAIRYAVGIYNGDTLRSANGARFRRIYGLAPVNRLSLRDPEQMDVPHPEVVGRLSYEGSEGSYVSVSAAWDIRPVHTQDETLRLAVDAHLARGPIRLWVAGYLSTSERMDGSQTLALGGALTEVAWRLHSKLELALRQSSVVRTERLLSDVARFGELQIANMNPEERPAASERYAQLAAVRAELETTAAVNILLAESDARVSLDASWLSTMRINQRTNQFRARLQLQLAF